MEILYQDNSITTFEIFGTKIYLISDQTEYGISTVAEINEQYYYAGIEDPNLELGIFIYQDFNEILLSEEQLDEINLLNK